MALGFEGIHPQSIDDDKPLKLTASLGQLKTRDGNPVLIIDPLANDGSHDDLVGWVSEFTEMATLVFVHECHVDVKVLGNEFFEIPKCKNKFIDTQLVYEYFSDDHSPFASLSDVLRLFGVEEEKQPTSTRKKTATAAVDHSKWMERPLNAINVHYAAVKVSLLHQAIPSILKMIEEASNSDFPLLDILCKATQLRINNTFSNYASDLNTIAQRRRTFEFDDNHTLRSIELMQAEDEALLASGRATQRQDRNNLNNKLEAFCDPASLINLLPEPFKGVLSVPATFEQVTTKACDIAFDLQREPYIIHLSEGDSYEDDRYYFMRGHNATAAAPSVTNIVSTEHLEEITQQLIIGGDHRAGINGELHQCITT